MKRLRSSTKIFNVKLKKKMKKDYIFDDWLSDKTAQNYHSAVGNNVNRIHKVNTATLREQRRKKFSLETIPSVVYPTIGFNRTNRDNNVSNRRCGYQMANACKVKRVPKTSSVTLPVKRSPFHRLSLENIPPLSPIITAYNKLYADTPMKYFFINIISKYIDGLKPSDFRGVGVYPLPSPPRADLSKYKTTYTEEDLTDAQLAQLDKQVRYKANKMGITSSSFNCIDTIPFNITGKDIQTVNGHVYGQTNNQSLWNLLNKVYNPNYQIEHIIGRYSGKLFRDGYLIDNAYDSNIGSGNYPELNSYTFFRRILRDYGHNDKDPNNKKQGFIIKRKVNHW